MTRNIYILIISLLATIAYAGNNPGIDFYKAGEPDIAKKLFLEQLNSSPAEKAVALYYLGEIAFDAGQPAEALNYYKQGWETNPEYAFNKVGEGKILLKQTDRPPEKHSTQLSKSTRKMQISMLPSPPPTRLTVWNQRPQPLLKTPVN